MSSKKLKNRKLNCFFLDFPFLPKLGFSTNLIVLMFRFGYSLFNFLRSDYNIVKILRMSREKSKKIKKVRIIAMIVLKSIGMRLKWCQMI